MVKIEIKPDDNNGNSETPKEPALSNGKSGHKENNDKDIASIEENQHDNLKVNVTPGDFNTSTPTPSEPEDKRDLTARTKGNSQFTSRKFEPQKTLPQGPFPAHKVKYNTKRSSGDIEWPKDAKFFELVEVYLPSLEVPDHVKRDAKRLVRRRRWRRKKTKKTKKNNAKETDAQNDDQKDVKDAEMQTESALNESLVSTKDIRIAIESLESTDFSKARDNKAEDVNERATTPMSHEEGAPPDPGSKPTKVDDLDGLDEATTAQTETHVASSDNLRDEEGEVSGDVESGPEIVNTAEKQPQENGARAKTTTGADDHDDVSDDEEEEEETESESDEGNDTEGEEDTEDKASQTEVPIYTSPGEEEQKGEVTMEKEMEEGSVGEMSKESQDTDAKDDDGSDTKSTSTNDSTIRANSSHEQPPTADTLMKEEQTAKEVRDMYKEEVIQLFNQMEQFRIQCNKESAKHQEKLERKKRKVVEEMEQLKRERDAMKAKITIEYIKEDTDLIRKKDDMLKKGAWILEMEEKLKNRKENLGEWDNEMDEIEGYLTRRYEFAKRKEENLADVDIELRKLRDVLDEEKAELERSDLDPATKKSRKAQLHWDFVQKATLEKEQLFELAIDRHKKRAKALQEQLDETGVYIEDQNEKLNALSEELTKKEQKIKELDAHLNIVLQESLEREREIDNGGGLHRGHRGSSLRGLGVTGSESSASMGSSLTRSKSYPARGKSTKTNQFIVNHSAGPVAGYSGGQPSGYRGGKGALASSVAPQDELPSASHPPNDTKLEFNSKGAGMSRMCLIM